MHPSTFRNQKHEKARDLTSTCERQREAEGSGNQSDRSTRNKSTWCLVVPAKMSNNIGRCVV